MKSNQEDSLVLVFKPNLHLQGSLYKWSFKTSLRFKLWGWNMEKLVVLHPDFTNISPAKGRLEDDVPPFSGNIRSFSGGVFLQKGPHL